MPFHHNALNERKEKRLTNKSILRYPLNMLGYLSYSFMAINVYEQMLIAIKVTQHK
jgi:hypothetical protein